MKWIWIVAASLTLLAGTPLLAGTLNGDQVEFRLTGNGGDGLLPGNVTPGTASTGIGGLGLTGIVFDLDTNILIIDIAWGSENGFSD